MDWYDHFSDDFRGAVVDSLLKIGPSRILSGFSHEDAVGPLSKALISVISEAIGELWATQAGDGMSPLRVSDAIQSLGLSNRNLPFVRELQDTLDTLRDRLVVNEDTLHSLIDRAKKRRSRGAPPEYQFAKKNMWAILFNGTETFLESTLKGPVFIKYLLQHQGEEIHVARMLADIAGDERLAQASDAGDTISKEEIADYRKRYDELMSDREEATEWNDEGRLQTIDEELGQIAVHLGPLLGLGGRSRKASDDVGRIRKAIGRVIGIALDKIMKNDAALEQHFRNSIRTHTYMSYQPETPIDWNFE